MQKIISFFLLGASLFLLFLSMTNQSLEAIRPFPPFCGIPDVALPKAETKTGADFSITSKTQTPSSLYAKSYCLLDADSRRVLLGEKETQQMPMASTTKIMTCIVALEHGDLDSKVEVSSYAASMPDVQLNMQAGDHFYLKDLLYSLMLESHNDTAVAIAEHIGKSVEGFASLMNKKASELGCTDTHFVTPNGLDAEGHYTTAKELCVIASYAIQNETFLKIIQEPSHSFTNCEGNRSYSVNNHDAFLRSYPGAVGIKTGFTGNAGYCFCGAAKRNGKTLITSVLACGWPPHKGYKWVDTKKLMDYGFSNFEKVSLKRLRLPKELPVFDGMENAVSVTGTKQKNITLLLKQDDKIKSRIKLSDSLHAPIRNGDIVGYEEYYLNGELLCHFPITAAETVQKRNPAYYLNIAKMLFLFA